MTGPRAARNGSAAGQSCGHWCHNGLVQSEEGERNRKGNKSNGIKKCCGEMEPLQLLWTLPVKQRRQKWRKGENEIG